MAYIDYSPHFIGSKNLKIKSKTFITSWGDKVVAPEGWSIQAVEIVSQKYFRTVNQKKESSVFALVDRVVDVIQKAAVKNKYFDLKKAKIFSQELKFICLTQRGFFNSPVWFNCGVYKKPQVSACFIQSIEDNLESIFSLLKKESDIFRYGSGSGTNFSNLRGKDEKLKDLGASAGLISFLEIFDKSAGAIKSGGISRRAAKMVLIDDDHPEVLDFINWKNREEEKAKKLILSGLDSQEAYKTISGQNSNNSIRLSDKFLAALANNKMWSLINRTNRKVSKKILARDLWSQIVDSAWSCADPGLQFSDTVNKWNPCLQDEKIVASNPCSEYFFLNETACNLASVNLIQFLNENGSFLWEDFSHTARTLFIAQDILVDIASYPTAEIHKRSLQYRPLGLGFCGLGSMFMRKLIPYDSSLASEWASSLSLSLQVTALTVSVQLAKTKGAFLKFKDNRKSFLKVINQHVSCAKKRHKQIKDAELKSVFKNLNDMAKEIPKQINKYGIRNAQHTLMAPTGTIGLAMDCETTGIEPEFSLVKTKNLEGGGQLSFLSESFLFGLKKLNYSQNEISKIKNNLINGKPYIHFIKLEHRKIFECAIGNAFFQDCVSVNGHLNIMAAIQPFISGGISKTVNLPSSASKKDISDIYLRAWKLGLKSISVYRDGSKGLQPLVSADPTCLDCFRV
jgi:ribonucleoside-diphosphate reductase alpha chain